MKIKILLLLWAIQSPSFILAAKHKLTEKQTNLVAAILKINGGFKSYKIFTADGYLSVRLIQPDGTLGQLFTLEKIFKY